MEFPFGQPTDAIIQVAYTVPDLAAGMRCGPVNSASAPGS